MIRVTLTQLIFVYLFCFTGMIFGLWSWFWLQRKRRERLALRYRVRCTICACEFEDATSNPLPCCPRCGRPNERDQFRTL